MRGIHPNLVIIVRHRLPDDRPLEGARRVAHLQSRFQDTLIPNKSQNKQEVVAFHLVAASGKRKCPVLTISEGSASTHYPPLKHIQNLVIIISAISQDFFLRQKGWMTSHQ